MSTNLIVKSFTYLDCSYN